MPFDTSALPDNAVISSSTLSVDPVSNTLKNDAYGFVTVVQTTQASPTTLSLADYDQCGAISNPTEGVDAANRVTSTQITVENYIHFPLNSTGLSWISLTGYTKLGIREGHDALNVDPVADSIAAFYSSKETGTAKDPYLSITYSETVKKSIKVNNGRIKVNNGRIKIN